MAVANDTLVEEQFFPYWSVFIPSFMTFSSGFGNLFVLFLFMTNKSIRIPNNNFIISLCVADLLTGLLVVPFAMTSVINHGWDNGVSACAFYLFVNIVTHAASVYSVCALILMRACAAQFPIRYRAFATTKVSATVVAAVWFLALVNATYMTIGWFEAPVRMLCHLGQLGLSYVFIIVFLEFVLPLTILTLGSVYLINALRQQARKIQQAGSSLGGKLKWY